MKSPSPHPDGTSALNGYLQHVGRNSDLPKKTSDDSSVFHLCPNIPSKGFCLSVYQRMLPAASSKYCFLAPGQLIGRIGCPAARAWILLPKPTSYLVTQARARNETSEIGAYLFVFSLGMRLLVCVVCTVCIGLQAPTRLGYLSKSMG